MKKLLLALLLLAPMARANDAAFSGIGGSLSPLKGQHSHIRMRSEKVVLIAQKSGFQTRATFDFVNESARPVTVQMGYPETNYGDGWEAGEENKSSGFSRFATWVDGRKVSAKRVLLRHRSDDWNDIWWVKTVRFAPRETKTIRVETFSEYGERVDWGFQNCVSYQFTGGNWRGNVARSELEVQIGEPGLWCAVGNSWRNEKPTYWKPEVQLQKNSAVLKRVWRNWQAQDAVYIGLWKTIPFWMVEVGGNTAIVDDQVVKNVATFRVGAKPQEMPPLGSNAPQAFFKEGTTFVAFWHLTRRLDYLGGEKRNVTSNFDAKTQSATLISGEKKLRFTRGKRGAMLLSGAQTKNFDGPAPIFLREEGGGQSLWVPLGVAAQALGFKIQVKPSQRRFSIGAAP